MSVGRTTPPITVLPAFLGGAGMYTLPSADVKSSAHLSLAANNDRVKYGSAHVNTHMDDVFEFTSFITESEFGEERGDYRPVAIPLAANTLAAPSSPLAIQTTGGDTTADNAKKAARLDSWRRNQSITLARKKSDEARIVRCRACQVVIPFELADFRCGLTRCPKKG
jgi:hypothetical protein